MNNLLSWSIHTGPDLPRPRPDITEVLLWFRLRPLTDLYEVSPSFVLSVSLWNVFHRRHFFLHYYSRTNVSESHDLLLSHGEVREDSDPVQIKTKTSGICISLFGNKNQQKVTVYGVFCPVLSETEERLVGIGFYRIFTSHGGRRNVYIILGVVGQRRFEFCDRERMVVLQSSLELGGFGGVGLEVDNVDG